MKFKCYSKANIFFKCFRQTSFLTLNILIYSREVVGDWELEENETSETSNHNIYMFT